MPRARPTCTGQTPRASFPFSFLTSLVFQKQRGMSPNDLSSLYLPTESLYSFLRFSLPVHLTCDHLFLPSIGFSTTLHYRSVVANCRHLSL